MLGRARAGLDAARVKSKARGRQLAFDGKILSLAGDARARGKLHPDWLASVLEARPAIAYRSLTARLAEYTKRLAVSGQLLRAH